MRAFIKKQALFYKKNKQLIVKNAKKQDKICPIRSEK